MKIYRIIIKKFRSIEYCDITLDSINAIVGQNNSGKSAIIRALNSFFNPQEEESSYFQGKHFYTTKTIPKIIVYFNTENTNTIINSYSNNNTLEIEQSYTQSNKKLSYKYKKDTRFIVAPDELINEIKKLIGFVYIPPNRTSEQLKWDENSLIKILIEEYLKTETQKRDTLTPKFKNAVNYLETKALNKISKDVEKYYSLRHNFNFSLNFNKESNFLSFLNNIEMLIHENGIEHYLDDCGTGLQSLTIIAFHRVLAKLKHKNIILGLEEPETNLHPQAQRELIASISNSSNNDEDVIQVILTTHSPILIDNISHLNIALIRKEKDTNRGFKSKVYKLKDTFFQDYNLEEFKYYQFHFYRNSDFFYANYIIFVESKNDAEVVKFLAKRENIDLDLFGISIINIDGVRNLAYPFYIVKELGIPYLAILDKDYFIPYLNDNLKDSRDSQGLPKYRYEFKNDIILEDLVSTQRDREQLLIHMKNNYAKALKIFEKHNIVCMRYNLEMDLLGSNVAVEEMCNILNINNISNLNDKKRILLETKYKAIKRIDNILKILDKLSNQNLPISYKKIKKSIKEIANKT